MASDASDIDDELLIFEDTIEIITAPYGCTDPIEIITTLASDDDWDKLGVNPPALTADKKIEESGDEGIQDSDKGEPEKESRGPQEVDLVVTPDIDGEMEEFTEVWNNLRLKHGWRTDNRSD